MKKRGLKPTIFLTKNRRGQFYLIAGIIIIGLISGFMFVTNYTRKETPAKINEIKDELKIESRNVIDYALRNEEDIDINTALENFAKKYSEYSYANNFYFVFGNTNKITFAGLKKTEAGTVGVDVGSGKQEISFGKNVWHSQPLTPSGNTIKVIIEEDEYPFTLYNGENFYFIVSHNIKGERYIVVG